MGLALSPAMIAAMGWPSVFYIFGSLGVLWYTAWSSKAASTPADDPMISREEKVREGGRGCGGVPVVVVVLEGGCHPRGCERRGIVPDLELQGSQHATGHGCVWGEERMRVGGRGGGGHSTRYEAAKQQHPSPLSDIL